MEKISKGQGFKSSLSFNSPNFLYKSSKETLLQKLLKKIIFFKKKKI